MRCFYQTCRLYLPTLLPDCLVTAIVKIKATAKDKVLGVHCKMNPMMKAVSESKRLRLKLIFRLLFHCGRGLVCLPVDLSVCLSLFV